MEKGAYIRELPETGAVTGIFCVAEKRLLQTKNGSPYLALTLVDNSGEVEARLWEDVSDLAQLFEKGDFLHIKGECHKFRDAIQIKINHFEPIPVNQVDPQDFLPSADADLEDLWQEFVKCSRRVKEPALAILLHTMIKDAKFKQLVSTAPAAKRMHHAYLGGLLEHTVSVAKLAMQVSKHYTHLDKDLLLAGALLHDIGKIRELSYDKPPIDYSDEGRLIGHLVLGTQEVDHYAKIGGIDLNSKILTSLKHLILSHHGQREYGAPVLPMMEEGVVLHLIDDMDAKLNYLKGLKLSLDGTEQQWTQYQRIMDRYFFLSPDQAKDQGAASEKNGDDETRLGQKKLWDSF